MALHWASVEAAGPGRWDATLPGPEASEKMQWSQSGAREECTLDSTQLLGMTGWPRGGMAMLNQRREGSHQKRSPSPAASLQRPPLTVHQRASW